MRVWELDSVKYNSTSQILPHLIINFILHNQHFSMAKLTEIGRIQTNMSTQFYVGADEFGSVYVSSDSSLHFYQVTHPELSSACLLASYDLKKVLQVSYELSADGNSQKVILQDAPCTIVNGAPLDLSKISDSMIFMIKPFSDKCCTIESKRYSGQVLDVYCWGEEEKTPVCCYRRTDGNNQIFRTQNPYLPPQ